MPRARHYRRLERVRDDAARNALVEQWTGLPLKVARTVWRHFLSVDEARDAGMIGLIRAAELWDETKDIAFSTYAWRWIKTSIQDADCSAAPIKVPRAYMDRRATFSKYNAAARHALGCMNFIGTVGEDIVGTHRGEEEWLEREEILVAIRAIADGLLTRREWHMFHLRYEEGLSLRDAGLHLGISHEWARQLHFLGVQKIRQALQCQGFPDVLDPKPLRKKKS